MKCWAKEWDCCQGCGTIERPHWAKGLCKQCSNHQYYLEHCEERRAYSRRYRKEHLEEQIGYNCQYRQEHRAERITNSRQYYQEHREEMLDYSRQWKAEHPNWSRQWRAANPDFRRRWAEANPGKLREKGRRYRARKKGATVGPVDEQRIYERDNYHCVYCGTTDDLELDHIIPIAGGGQHCEENLAVACRSCNASKQDKPLAIWVSGWANQSDGQTK